MSDSTRSQTHSHGYWQSLEELAGDEAFARSLEQEFSDQADSPLDSISRRRVLQVMSASVALAGLSGCRWPAEEIVPFDRRPESYQPGKISRYATSLDVAGTVRPVVVSSYDGRPIKIEGNPGHPASAGATDALTQANLLELYDRDRSRQPVIRADGLVRRSSWQEFEAAIPGLMASGAETRLAVLSRPHASPTLERAAERLLQRFPALGWYEFAANRGPEEAEGLEAVFGRPVTVGHDLERARVIVDFDADLLVGHPEGVSNARGFAQGRKPVSGAMNRLYVFEPLQSATGAAADHRVPVAPSQVVGALAALAAKLQNSGRLRRPEALAGLDLASLDLTSSDLTSPAGDGAEDLSATLQAAAQDLLDHAGEGLIALGDRYPAAAHALVHRMNLALANEKGSEHGNDGEPAPLRYRPAPERRVERGTLKELTARLEAGEIDCLLILDGNPVYDAPPDLDFAAALDKAGSTVHLGLSADETAAACRWHLPMAHGLESWGDSWDLDGRLCATQPLIRPLFEGRTAAELLSLLADETPRTAHEMVQQTFAELRGSSIGGSSGASELIGGSFNGSKAWRRFLHDGFLELDGAGEGPGGDSAQLVSSIAWGDLDLDDFGTSEDDGLELDLRPDARVVDGRYANNAWLQELPDALTKLTWGNAALLAPSLADELGLEHEDLVRIATAVEAIELPVFVVPGMAKNTVSVALGYGRRQVGRVGRGGDGRIGVDAYALQTWDQRWIRRGVALTAVGGKGTLTSTQNHYAIDNRGKAERERRVEGLVREGTLEDFEHHPEFAQHLGIHHPPLISLWNEREGQGHQWGMAIDLNACIACNACVTACQAENNIPVVGQEEVGKGREMHWIRIDRYFHGDPDTARVAHQPVACVHCELAPCEQVCPVGATMHSKEGLNVMAYNRCVGTRYCANNCPYKVRRFNFFNLNKDVTELEALGKNPEVTIRSRGVMEKCSYCVQRIEHARIEAKNEDRQLRDGDVVTACQQACPSQAITFGDLADADSEVAKQHSDPRAYAMLAELNVKPRTVYLARIRNPHPDLSAPSAHGAGAHGPATEGHSSEGHSSNGHDGQSQNSEHEGGH
ncbi:MAG: TAT-variant-translocated molybdopterin oxidoreductase [Acidobacteriota bacterium]|nr:TAT-variant-translocated molybdopterin oxidoreductase [Acidobacteriota bacterium]